jgi:hypothetical protein
MADCNHSICKNKDFCGHIIGDKKNPGGNIFTPGQKNRHKGHIVEGWHTEAQCAYYNNLIKPLKEGNVVEVGVFGGASLLGVVDTCIKTGSHLYGIDPWELVETANGAKMDNQKKDAYRSRIMDIRLNLERIINKEGYDNITLIHGFSTDASNLFEDASIDIVFIDGDHSYDAVYMDMETWLPKVKAGGVMWGDDFGGWNSVRMAVNDFCADNKLIYKIVCGNRSWRIDV